MKRIALCVLVMLLMSALYGCGSDTEDGVLKEHSYQEYATEHTEEEAVPSESIITNDIKNALSVKNQYAEITETSIIKSLTEDSTYFVTLGVNASTKYADWTYEVSMSYTRYDQGWMLDSTEWTSESYEQVRIPDVVTMVNYAEGYLPNHETYSDVWFTEYMVPIQSPTIEFGLNSVVNADVMEFCWVGEEKLKHATKEHYFTSLWQYDPQIDNWTLYPDDTHGSLGYHLSDSEGELSPNYKLDFTGQWKNNIRIGNSVLPLEIDISNFSWLEFDAKITWEAYDYAKREPAGTKKTSGHFTRIDQSEVPADLTFNLYGAHCIFSNNDGGYISFNFSENSTLIQYVAYGDGVLYLSVDKELPSLQ